MRKFLLLIYLLVGLGFLNATNGQNVPSSATWPLSDPSTGGTGLTVITAGQVIAASENLVGLSLGAPAYKLIGTTNMQRSQMTGGWPAGQTAKVNTVYTEFAVSAKSGFIFHVDSIAMSIAALSIATLKADIYYSTDPTFATATQIPYTTGLTSGTSTNVLSSTALQRVKISSLGLALNPGQTLYVRVYPWVEGLASTTTGKYLMLLNVVVGGEVESLPVASKVVWGYNPSPIYITTGPIVGQASTYSPAMKYYGKTALPISGTTTNLNVGAIQTVVKVWTTAPNPVDSLYFQYNAMPKTGGTLTVDSVSLYLGGWYSSNLRAAVYYSKDPTFATKTQLIKDTALVGNAVQLLGSKLSASVIVNTGEAFYLRVYPHNKNAEGWAKLVAVDSVKIVGSVTGVTSDPPSIANTKVSYISTTFASTGGNVSSDGGAPVTAKGVCWATTASPTTSNNKTTDGTGSGAFTSKIAGLTAGTLYHVRAYATNSSGTSYGGDSTFTTLAAIVVPTVTKTSASSILVTSANAGGNATAWGGDTIKTKGVCWNTTGNPTINDSKTVNGTDLGSFTSILYPLVQNTKYYFKAYATNSAGTGYSVVDSFTTKIPDVDVTKTVAKDGSGDYTSIQAAFNAVPLNYTGKYTINVKPGSYYEKDTLAANKVNVILKGIHPDSTIIWYNAYADSPKTGGGTMGTNGCFTFGINANDFTAINITFQNTIKNDGSHTNEQAVALFTNADRLNFINCKLLGYQDTYYAGGGSNMGRTYMKNCYIEGSVDFIFGNATVLFDSCEMHVNRDGGPVTAPSTYAASKFGYVFRNCKISADSIGFNGVKVSKIYLGRAWQNAPQSVYIKCYETSLLDPAGWTTMSVNPGLFAEYKCTGPGYSPLTRSTNPASLGKQLSDLDAGNYSLVNIFKQATNPAFGFDWLPDTTICKFKQTTGLGTLAAKKYGDASFKVKTTSKLPVILSSSDANVASIKGDSVIIKGAGTVTLKAIQAGNYLYSAAADSVKSLTVVKADLTAKADDMTKKHNDANPTFTITYTGFVNGDTKANITEPTISCTAIASSAVGTYPITLTGGASANYNIIMSNGTLTITPGTPVNTLTAAEIAIYPNPASNVIKVKRISSLPEPLSIFDMNGSKIIEKKLVSDLEDVDISNLPKGTYMIRLEGTMYKLVVQ